MSNTLLVFSHDGWVFKLDDGELSITGEGNTQTFGTKRHNVKFDDLVAFGLGWTAAMKWDKRQEV